MHTETIQAPYKFTPFELEQKNRQLRSLLNTIDRLKDAKSQSAKEYALQIEKADAEARLVRNHLDTGIETRMVQAVVTFEPAIGKKSYFYSGQYDDAIAGRFIRTEDMTDADYQMDFIRDQATGDVSKPVVNGSASEEASAGAPAAVVTEPAPEFQADNTGTLGEDHTNSGPIGTNIGDAINDATIKTEFPKLQLVIVENDDTAAVVKSFRKAAKAAQWSDEAIKLMAKALKAADGIEAIHALLDPHIEPPATPEQVEPMPPEPVGEAAPRFFLFEQLANDQQEQARQIVGNDNVHKFTFRLDGDKVAETNPING